MAELHAPDLDVRLRTLAPDRSFIVQAPAGSGKTTLLTQRFLGLLAVVERPEQIVAITFTRKAAAEMRHRILQALRLGAGAVPDGATSTVRTTWELAQAALEADARRGWRLLDHPSRLHISTIDGLNHWLARHLPLTSRLGDGLELVDDAQPLYLEAANRFVLRLEEDSPEGRAVDRLARLLDHDPARLADLLAAMLARRELWLPRLVGVTGGPELRTAMERVLAVVVEQGLAQAAASVPVELARELVEALNESARLAGPTSTYAGLRDYAALPPARAKCLDDWRAICAAVLTGKDGIRRRLTVKEGFPPQHKALKARFQALLEQLAAREDAVAAFASVRKLPPPHYTDRQWELVAALCDALVPAAAELQAVFAERGRMDHSAVAAAARWALGSEEQPSDLGLALDYRIQHLLVDEFQDTSQSQELLLRRLVAGWEPGPGHTLFCVGDPMQSVYAFREADVTLFLGAQRSGIGPVRLEVEHLQANFRSCAALVDWINRTFRRLLPASDDFERGAVHYTPCVHTRPDEAGAGVQVHALIGDETDDAAALVAQLAAAAVAEADAGGPDAATREVAVLVRGRAVLPAIIAALQRRGVPYRGVELEGLADRSAVRDLLALARALLNAGDRTAWLAVLRAPWCGLLLPDLVTLVGPDPTKPVPARLEALVAGEAGLPADGARRIARIWPVLAAAVADIGRQSLGSVVRSAWLALGGPATLEDESDLDNAETVFAAFDLLVQETGPLPAASALESALERLKASPVGSASARVHLMTIHKAKGLEFDTVIVPGLERGAPKDDRRLLYWTAVATGPDSREVLLASRGESQHGAHEDALEAWMRRLDRERQQLELGRLAYVAVTRARRRLHLVGAAALRGSGDADEPVLQQPRADSMLGFLWPALAADFERRCEALRARGGLARAAPAARPRASDGNLRRLPADFQLDATALDAWSARRQPRDATGPIRPEFDWAGQVAIAVGTVVHAELVERAGPGFAEAGSAALARGRSAALLAAGLPAERLPLAVARVEQSLQRVAASPVARHLLDSRHAHAASELALTAMLDGEPVAVQIDRTFVDAAGVRWIADWKTGSHEGGDREAFLASELRRYGGQLARYSAVMRLLDGRPQRVGLYYPLLDAWVEWSPANGGESPPE